MPSDDPERAMKPRPRPGGALQPEVSISIQPRLLLESRPGPAERGAAAPACSGASEGLFLGVQAVSLEREPWDLRSKGTVLGDLKIAVLSLFCFFAGVSVVCSPKPVLEIS